MMAPAIQWQKVGGVALVALLLCLAFSVFAAFYNMVFAFAAVMALVLTILMFVKPEFATLVVIFVLYANLAVVAHRFHGVPQIVAGSFFFLLGIPLANYLIVRRQKLIINPILVLMGGYLGILLISTVLSQQPSDSFGPLLAYATEGFVLYFLIFNTIRTHELLRKVIWVLILAGVFMGGFSMYQEITGTYDNEYWGLAQVKESEINTGRTNIIGNEIERQRLGGTIGSKNRYAQIMVVLLPLAMFRVWAERSRWLQFCAALSCVPILSGALLTFSRGAGVSIVVTLLAMVYLRVIKLWQFIVIGLLGVAVMLVAVPDYAYRISTVVGVVELAEGNVQEADGAVRGRATVNLAAANIFLDNPILGVGPGQAPLYMMEYGNDVGFRYLTSTRRAHNMYLEELAETGIVGFGLFTAIIVLTMYQLRQMYNKWKDRRPDIGYTVNGLLVAIIAYLSTAVFLHLSYVRYYWFLLGLAGAAIYIYQNNRVNTTDVPKNDTVTVNR